MPYASVFCVLTLDPTGMTCTHHGHQQSIMLQVDMIQRDKQQRLGILGNRRRLAEAKTAVNGAEGMQSHQLHQVANSNPVRFIVQSCTLTDRSYAVTDPEQRESACTCIQGQHGKLCKHHVRVLTELGHSTGNIIRYLGEKYGTEGGGLRGLHRCRANSRPALAPLPQRTRIINSQQPASMPVVGHHDLPTAGRPAQSMPTTAGSTHAVHDPALAAQAVQAALVVCPSITMSDPAAAPIKFADKAAFLRQIQAMTASVEQAAGGSYQHPVWHHATAGVGMMSSRFQSVHAHGAELEGMSQIAAVQPIDNGLGNRKKRMTSFNKRGGRRVRGIARTAICNTEDDVLVTASRQTLLASQQQQPADASVQRSQPTLAEITNNLPALRLCSL